MSFGYGRFLASRARFGCVFAYWASRLVGAMLVASPLARQLAVQTRHMPQGDSVLFEPGALFLLEALSKSASSLRVALQDSVVLLLLVSTSSVALLLALVVSLAQPRNATPAMIAARLMAQVRAQLTLSVAYWLLLAGWGLACLVIFGVLATVLAGLSEPDAELTLLVVGLGLTLPAAVLQPWLDLARAHHAQRGPGALDDSMGSAPRVAAIAALGALRNHPRRVLGSWLVTSLGGVGCAGLASWWSLSNTAANVVAHPWLTILLQQLAIGALTLSRVAWLSDAAQLVASGRTNEDGDSSPEVSS